MASATATILSEDRPESPGGMAVMDVTFGERGCQHRT
jgi:hypothetical protein